MCPPLHGVCCSLSTPARADDAWSPGLTRHADYIWLCLGVCHSKDKLLVPHQGVRHRTGARSRPPMPMGWLPGTGSPPLPSQELWVGVSISPFCAEATQRQCPPLCWEGYSSGLLFQRYYLKVAFSTGMIFPSLWSQQFEKGF